MDIDLWSSTFCAHHSEVSVLQSCLLHYLLGLSETSNPSLRLCLVMGCITNIFDICLNLEIPDFDIMIQQLVVGTLTL